MKMRRGVSFLLMCLVLMMALLSAGCEHIQGHIDFSKTQTEDTSTETNTADNGATPLRVAFASVMSPQETREAYQQLVDYISKELKRPAIVLQRRTYEELNMLMAGGDADVAFFSTGAYSAYKGMQPIELLAMVQTNGTTMYRTYLIAPAGSNATTLDDLQGKVFAFTDPISYSGKIAIDFELLDRHTTVEAFFKRCFFTYNHDKSIWAVANHLADAASVDSQIYDFAVSKNPELANKVKVVAVLQEAPTGPVVIRSNMPESEKNQIRNVFYKMSSVQELRPAMKKVVIDRFIPPRPEMYSPLREKYRRLYSYEGN